VFNQPVSFDTSSATAMSFMFYVRSAARALPPHTALRLGPSRALLAPAAAARAPGLVRHWPRAARSGARSALSPPVCRCVWSSVRARRLRPGPRPTR
jgi:hypothetical protein